MPKPEIPLLLQGRASILSAKSNSNLSNSGISSISSFTNDHHNSEGQLKENLHNCILRKSDDILQAIKNYDRLETGKILPIYLYNVLRVFCFPLSYKEFESFVKEVPEDGNGYISYKSFLPVQKSHEKGQKGEKPCSETRVDSDYLNIEDLEIRIKDKIQHNLKNFIRCVLLHDLNNDGIIQKDDFKTVLENICFPLNNELFNRFWSFYDPCHSGVINYKDFLLKLGHRTESYKRLFLYGKEKHLGPSKSLIPKNNSKQEQIQLLHAKLGRDDPSIQGHCFSKILEIFTDKVKKEYHLLLRTMEIKDPKCTGFINLSTFHEILNYFVMPTSISLFKEILRSFNVPTNTTKVAWKMVLKRICEETTEWMEESQNSLKGSISWEICNSVMENLKKHGKNEDNIFKNAYMLPAPNGELSVTRSELRRIINQSLTLPLSDEELKHIMFLVDPSHSNFVSCKKFLSIFKIVNKQNKESMKHHGDETKDVKNLDRSLTGEKLRKTFKKHFNKNLKNIQKVLFAFDKEEGGTVSIQDFKKILDVFCFPMTESQYFEIINGFTIMNKVYYGDIIHAYKKGIFEDEEKWKACINKLVSSKLASKISMDSGDLAAYMKEIIRANRENLQREFLNNDLCKTGAMRKEVFFKILEKLAFKLTEEQLENLWHELPKSDIGLLKYEEFLNEWCCRDHSENNKSRHNLPMKSSSKNSHSSYNGNQRPKTTGSDISRKSSIVSSRPISAISRLSSSTLSIKSDSNFSIEKNEIPTYSILTKQQYNQYKSLNMEKKLIKHEKKEDRNMNLGEEISTRRNNINDFELVIKRRWRDVLRRCKQSDIQNQDTIHWHELIGILQNIGITLDEKLEYSLENKYGLKKNSKVNYWVLLNRILSNKNSFHGLNVNQQMSSKGESTGFSKVLLTYRDKIKKNYKDLKHAFQRADTKHAKQISMPDFKKILMLHKINMKNQDLFYIQDYFDTMLTGNIPYDKFLKAFEEL